VILVESRYSLIADIAAPRDPLLYTIDPRALITPDLIRLLISTFEGALRFYILINGWL
jgi:hypothetical protein